MYFSFNRTPVIMASGRELCYVLLVGILSCYGMSFVILSKPTTWNCTYLRIGLGLCLSICYSAILTKTNRISRIFNQGTKSIKRPSYTSPKSQVVIAIGELLLLEVCVRFHVSCFTSPRYYLHKYVLPKQMFHIKIILC